MISARPRAENPVRPGLELEEVTTLVGFAALRADWDRLADRLDEGSPFHGWAWNWTWWKHFGRGRLRIVVIRSGDEVRGIAQFQVRRHGPLLSSMVPIGWGNRLTEQLDLLLPEEDRDELLGAIRVWLRRQRCTWVWLPGLRPEEVATAVGPVVPVHVKAIPFERLELPASWETLVAGLNKSMRDNVKYYPKLLRRHGHDYQFRIAAEREAVQRALPILFRLHRRRARMQGSVAHKDYLRDRSYRAFLEEVLPELAAAGQAKVGLLEIGGEAVAAIAWLEMGRSVFLYYSGFDPAWSKYSVVMVATGEVIKQAIEAGLERVEFLRGTDPFKTRWGTAQRTTVEVAVARRPGLLRPLLGTALVWRSRARRLRGLVTSGMASRRD